MKILLESDAKNQLADTGEGAFVCLSAVSTLAVLRTC